MCISVFYLAFLKMPRVTIFLLLLLLFIKINGFVLQKSNNSVENEGDAGSLRIIRSSQFLFHFFDFCFFFKSEHDSNIRLWWWWFPSNEENPTTQVFSAPKCFIYWLDLNDVLQLTQLTVVIYNFL